MKVGSVVRRDDGLTGEVIAIDDRPGPDGWALVEFDSLPEGEQNPQWWQIKDLTVL